MNIVPTSDPIEPAVVSAPLCSWVLPADSPIRRTPPRDPELRFPDFNERYDDRTVFFDLFFTDDPARLLAVCAPFLDLWDRLEPRFRCLPSGVQARVRRIPRLVIERLVIDVEPGTIALEVETRLGVTRLYPARDLAGMFRGAHVLTTVSKDNDLVWVRDWAQFHVVEHGIDAVLFYDNGSTRYGPQDIEAAISDVAGLERCCVIDWPFPYGPNDRRRMGTLWMSECDYCQRAVLEHASTRVLRDAATVVNADVDELAYCVDGGRLCDAVAASDSGYIEFPGHWVEAIPDDGFRSVRHVAYASWKSNRPAETCEPKYAVDPARLPEACQWMTHKVVGAVPSRDSIGWRFGHFRAINTNWDIHAVGNTSEDRTAATDEPLETIPQLRAALDRSFPDPGRGMIPTAPSDMAPSSLAVPGIGAAEPEDPTQPPARTAKQWFHRAKLANLPPADEDRTLDCLYRAHLAGPGEFVLLYELARKLSQTEAWSEALGTLRAARPHIPATDRRAMLALEAFLMASAGEGDPLPLFAEAIDGVAGKPGYLFRYAMALDARGQATAAEEMFERAVAMVDQPETRTAEWAFTTRCALVTGLVVTPYILFLERLHPGALARQYRIFLHRTYGPDRALEMARRHARIEPMSIAAQIELAGLLAQTDAAAEAEEQRAYVLRLANDLSWQGMHGYARPETREKHARRRVVDLCWALIAAGCPNDALPIGIGAFEHAEPDPKTALLLGMEFLRTKAIAQAATWAEFVRGKCPNDMDLRAFEIEVQALSGDLGALGDLPDGIEATGRWGARAVTALANALSRAGRPGDAALLHERMMKIEPGRLIHFIKAEREWARSGQPDRALAVARAREAIHPVGPSLPDQQ